MKRTHYIIWLGTFNHFRPDRKEYFQGFNRGGTPAATYEPLNAKRFSRLDHAERFVSEHSLTSAKVETIEVVH